VIILLYKNMDAECKNIKWSFNVSVLYTGIKESRIWPTKLFTCMWPEYMCSIEIKKVPSLIALMTEIYRSSEES